MYLVYIMDFVAVSYNEIETSFVQIGAMRSDERVSTRENQCFFVQIGAMRSDERVSARENQCFFVLIAASKPDGDMGKLYCGVRL